MALTLAEADRVAEQALSKAQELDIKISVAVCDGGGRLVLVDALGDANGEVVAPTRVGRIDNLIARVPVTPDRTSTIVLRQNEITYLRKHRSWVRPVIDASNTPFFINLIDEITEPSAVATRRAPLRADEAGQAVRRAALDKSCQDATSTAQTADSHEIAGSERSQGKLVALGVDAAGNITGLS